MSRAWDMSVRVYSEIWSEKVFSLFYLLVMGASTFEFSKDIGMSVFWQRLVLAATFPATSVALIILAAAFIVARFPDFYLVRMLIEAFRAFFQIFESDDYEENRESIVMTFKQRAFYVLMDYWAVLGCMGVVSLMNWLERSFIETTVVTTIYDFLIAWGFMIYSLRTGKDVTFGDSYRRAIDVIHRKSRIIGYIGMFALNAKATIWDGPEQVPIFFRRKLKHFWVMTAVLVPLSVIQGIFWAWLYSYGYDSVYVAAKDLVSSLPSDAISHWWSWMSGLFSR